MTYQVSSHNQSIAEHFEQKCRSDFALLSCGVPRSNTALYTLSSPSPCRQLVCQGGGEKGEITHEMCSFPLTIWSVSACAPRLIDPPAPPTFRQMEHWQSKNGTGVLD